MRLHRTRKTAPNRDRSRPVAAGELRVEAGAAGVLQTDGLGSGLGVAIYDPEIGIGGLLHAVLPEAAADPRRAREQPALFVDSGLEALLAELEQSGARAQSLRAYLAGAADARDCEGGAASLGCRNLDKALQVLGRLGIAVDGKRTGGYRIVSLRLSVRDTSVAVLDSAGREVQP